MIQNFVSYFDFAIIVIYYFININEFICDLQYFHSLLIYVNLKTFLQIFI